METNNFVVGPVLVVDIAAATVPTKARPIVEDPPTIRVVVPSTISALAVLVLPAYAKPFLDISRIEVFSGQNFKRW